MKSTNQAPHLTSFKVTGLHGDRDVEINFTQTAKIILSENGSGKTTAMNLLIGALSGRLRRPNSYEFQTIELVFRSGKVLTMTRKELLMITGETEVINDPKMRGVWSELGEEQFEELLEAAVLAESTSEFMGHHLFDEADLLYPDTTEAFAERIMGLAAERKMQSVEQHARRKEIREILKENFPLKILYLPTYRRVEDDIRTEQYARRRGAPSQDDPIKFGMRDVDELITSITEDIKRSSIRSYQRTSAEMLNQLSVDNLPSPREIAERLGRADDLNLVLGRLKSIISDDAKERIIGYINSGEILKESRQTLAFILSNLITIYDQTKIQDEKIKAFMGVVNSYLLGKEFVYDDINVNLRIVSTRTEMPLQLERLSSGEKQLVSVLAQLYLRDEGEFAVFFDEPELSLSMDWQERLLPDVLASGKCGLLLVATHSPFLFNNNLKGCVEALNVTFLPPKRQEVR